MRLLPSKRLLDVGGGLVSPGTFQGQALVSIGYDDGYKNNYTIALPIHEKHKIPATFFIVTDWINENKRYAPTMTTDDLINIQNKGYEIGAHSVTHTYDETLYPDDYPNPKHWSELTRNELDFEIGESKRQLETWGLKVRGFAAPFNQQIAHTDLYKKHGLRYNRVGVKKLETYPPFNNYALPSYIDTQPNVLVNTVKDAIDQTIQERGWLIITMHHVIASLDDTTVTGNSSYYWLAEQLDELLAYIASKPIEQLYPATIYEAFRLATNWQE